MKAKLEAAMDGWPSGARAAAVPKPAFTPSPGLYLVDKADVNQGRVSLGHLGVMRGDPDEVALEMMNDILGGSGFTSRIVNRIRSDEGLAYSAGSSFAPGVYYDGIFMIRFQSKSESVARATQIAIDEINRLRTEGVTEEELESVRNSAIETFPRRYQSAAATAQAFADDEMTGRDPSFWKTYRERVRAVTAADVQRVAQKYLHPDRLVILAVGNTAAMLAGDADRPQFSLQKIVGGTVTRIPLPDPMTMVYPKP
jgi:predicted Zn-dependent peptidase